MKVDPKVVAQGRYWTEGITLVSGCDRVSEGCKNCWSLALEKRCGREGEVTFHEERLARFAKGKPRMIAIWNDCFHKTVTDIQICDTLAAAWKAWTRGCVTIILTKRAERMAEWLFPQGVIVGVTAENQARLEERVPYLLKTQITCRMLSLEPLLGDIDLNVSYGQGVGDLIIDPSKGHQNISWVIVGAESGSNRRECKPEWVRSIVQQCKAAQVPVFVKQIHLNGKVSKDMDEWPSDIRVREFPNV
jgi:protein gp37